jgi:hypothetical protein
MAVVIALTLVGNPFGALAESPAVRVIKASHESTKAKVQLPATLEPYFVTKILG